jgi:ribonuclease H / adenosylcobalamin/alpha-ribazole phosphatase
MVHERVLAALDRMLDRHAGRTVVVASHVTPIKVVVAEALQAPLAALFRMEVRPASVTVVSFFTPPAGESLPGDGQRYTSLRQLNVLAPGVDLLDEPTRW